MACGAACVAAGVFNTAKIAVNVKSGVGKENGVGAWLNARLHPANASIDIRLTTNRNRIGFMHASCIHYTRKISKEEQTSLVSDLKTLYSKQ